MSCEFGQNQGTLIDIYFDQNNSWVELLTRTNAQVPRTAGRSDSLAGASAANYE